MRCTMIIKGKSPWASMPTVAAIPMAMAIGIGYAKYLTDRFAVGGQFRQVVQSLGKSVVFDESSDTGISSKRHVASVISVDFGTIFHTGFKSLAFGMCIRNYSKEIEYVEEGFQLPLLFTLGISMDIMDFEFDFLDFAGLEHSLLVSIDATHPRSHREQVKFGLDYCIMKVLSLRGGYIANNDEDDISFGVGVNYMKVALDYAYTPFGVFNNVQRVTARISF